MASEARAAPDLADSGPASTGPTSRSLSLALVSLSMDRRGGGHNRARRRLASFATSLAEFLVALQRADASAGPAPGAHNFFRGGPLGTYDGEMRRALVQLGSRVDAKAALDAPDTSEPQQNPSRRFKRYWASLTRAQKEAMRRVYIKNSDKLTKVEIALSLGIRIDTIQERLDYAIKKFKRFFPEAGN